jgi:hypothetical protein
MKRALSLFGLLAAASIAGCGGNREHNNDTGAAAGAGGMTDTMTGGTSADTARTGSRIHRDSMTGATDPSQGPRTKPDTSAGSNY